MSILVTKFALNKLEIEYLHKNNSTQDTINIEYIPTLNVYMDKKIHNLFKSTNISLLFRSFDIGKPSEKKRNICAFK